jgi:putative membrane protein
MDQGQDKSLAIPGCYQPQVDETLDVVVPGFRHATFASHGIHPMYVKIMVTLFGFLPALAFGLFAWWNDAFLQWLLVLVFPIAVWMGYLYHHKRRLKLHPDYLLSEGGIFGRSAKLIEIFKIQSVQLTSSPRQRRLGVLTLHVRTAGGHVTIPYLNAHVARQARDYILYKVEKERKPWM